MALNRLLPLRRFTPLLLVFIPAIMIGLQEPSPMQRGVRVVDVVAALPEAGGFQPNSVTVRAGQKLRLRFRAADTAHGVAIGPGLGVDLGDLAPGEVKVVDVTFDEAGTFTFYCNKWCSPNHWRMRGVIDVQDRSEPAQAPPSDPVIEQLLAEGINIDAETGHDHHATHSEMDDASSAILQHVPRAAEGAIQVAGLIMPSELQDEQWLLRHTPLEGESLLMLANPEVEHSVISDVVAYLWLAPLDTTASDAGAKLYAKNCAACHGDNGDGQGFAAASVSQQPPAFADAQHMATRRSDVLYAKIRRGGMGTGMPNFGTLFSPEETWSLVDYLWLLAFGR